MNDFRVAAEAAHGAGFTYFDQLGSRLLDEGVELWLRIMDPRTFEVHLIKTQIPTVGDLTSVADLWGGARWAERDLAADNRRAAALLTPNGDFAHPQGSS